MTHIYIWVQGGCMSKLLPDRHLHQVLTHIATRTASATQCMHLLPDTMHPFAASPASVACHIATHTSDACHIATHTVTATHCSNVLPDRHSSHVITLQHTLQLQHTAIATSVATHCNKCCLVYTCARSSHCNTHCNCSTLQLQRIATSCCLMHTCTSSSRLCACVCVWLCIYLSTCIHMYIYVYIYMYICIHAYTYVHFCI